MSHNPYVQYYVNQAGGGSSINFYRGYANQRGHGLGSILASLFRSIFPIFKKVAPIVGKQLVRRGLDVMGDVSKGEDVRTSLKRSLKEGGKNTLHQLGDMVGSGYIHSHPLFHSHSSLKGEPVRKRRKTAAAAGRKKIVKRKNKITKKKKKHVSLKKKSKTNKKKRSKLDIFG